MKRSVTEVIRRGFDLTMANWPLLLLRIGEHVLVAIIAIASIVAIIVPIAVSAGLGHFDINATDDVRAMLLDQLMQHWMLIVFILVIISVVLVIFVALHSFVQAGCADVYLHGTFTMDRFLAGGKRGWGRIFWIYNIAWLFAGVVMLIPLLPVPFIIASREDMSGVVIAGCIFGLWIFFAILIGLATALWSMKAIVLAMARSLDARTSLAEARKELRAAPGPNFAVGFIMAVIWLGGTALIGTMSGVMSIGHATPLALITAPLQLVISFVNAIFSSTVESWFLASYVSMES